MLSHGGLYHSRPAGLLLPLLQQPLTWTCSLDGSCHLWPRGRDEPGVMKGSKCSKRLPECAHSRPVGTLRSGESSGCRYRLPPQEP